MNNKPIAIIPARGGSKRIPKKNIVDFNGKPMLAWTIESALGSSCFSHVIVSTDSDDIAAVARDFGAEVPFLRDEHADDHSTVSEATCWTVSKLIDEGFDVPESVVQMMVNVPLKKPITIRRFVDELGTDRERSLISCFEPKFSPPHWAISTDAKGSGHFVYDQYFNKRSQDMPKLLIPTGAIWGASWSYLTEHKSFYGPQFRVFEMGWIEALDIDTPEELEICRRLSGLR